jgi:hypothetical protein
MLKDKKNFILILNLILFCNLSISAKLSKDKSKTELKKNRGLKRSVDLEKDESVVAEEEAVVIAVEEAEVLVPHEEQAEELSHSRDPMDDLVETLVSIDVEVEAEVAPAVFAEEGSVVVVDGDYICTDMKGIAEFRGIEGKPNNLYLTEDVQIDHKVTFNNLTIVGDAGTRGGKRFGLETVNGGFVNFGKDVTLKNCLIRNLKQQSGKKQDTK